MYLPLQIKFVFFLLKFVHSLSLMKIFVTNIENSSVFLFKREVFTYFLQESGE